MAQSRIVVGIIGGSGVYEIDGLEHKQWVAIDTPFGKPSDEVLTGELGGVRVVFLPRHGRGHRLSPTEVPYRANLYALKRLGVTEVVSLSACGSLREELPPGTFVLAHQFIDRTFARDKSFFGEGLVAHVSMAHPVCGRLGDALEAELQKLAVPHRRGGTYLVMEGPQFSTLAESRLYRSWGCDVIGMTNMPEAKLAREAELCYATVAMVTDFDCWHPDHDAVTVDQVVTTLHHNADVARALVKGVLPRLAGRAESCAQGCGHALDTAYLTAPSARSPEQIERLHPLVARSLGLPPTRVPT